MKGTFLLLTLAITLQTQAQEVLTAGPERFIGTPETMQWSDPVYRQPGLATHGDEVVVVWTDARAVYAMRLDREGRPLAGVPTLLAGGGNDAPYGRLSSNGVVVTGDLYTVFYAGPDRGCTPCRSRASSRSSSGAPTTSRSRSPSTSW